MEVIYFLDLIKKNAILYSILINGNFSHVDLRSQNVTVWSDKAIEIKKVSLGQDKFDSVMIVLYDSFISMEFRTSDPKFFTDSKLYFGKDALVRSKKPYLLNDNIVEEEFKDIGTFNAFKGPASITVRHFNLFNYTISLRFYGEQTNQKSLSKRTYFIKGIEIAQEALHLFKPNEITLIPTFTPFDYAPKIEIAVKNPDHPALKYFVNKASLSYGNRLYEYGKLPKINPYRVCGLTYIDQTGTDDDALKATSVLIVKLCPSNSKSVNENEDSISYEVLSPEIDFFKIGDHILTKEEVEVNGLKLEKDYILVKTLFGKEAVDEFDNLEYAQGISVYKSK
jgi:hypothetical protein